MTGEEFLDKLYKRLHLSAPVQHTASGSKDKYEKISRYMERLDRVNNKVNENDRKSLIKKYYYDKYIIKEENLPKLMPEVEKQEIIESQKDSLNDWIDYLMDSNYPMWIKYWIFHGMIRIGTYYDNDHIYMNRSLKTKAPFIELNKNIVRKTVKIIMDYLKGNPLDNIEMEEFIKHVSFKKIYTGLIEYTKIEKIRKSDKKDGIWIKYNQNSKEDAIKLSDTLQGQYTHWCTIDKKIAIKQLCGGGKYEGGDFYVYYTKDTDGNYTIPRVAIRMNGTKEIGEIKGIADSDQNLEEGLEQIIDQQLNEIQSKKYYKK